MEFLKRAPLVSFCILFLLGILLQDFFKVPSFFLAVALVVLAFVSWVLKRSGYLLSVLLMLTVVCGMSRLANTRLHYDQVSETIEPLEGNFVEMSGEVRSAHTREGGSRYIIESSRIRSAGLIFEGIIRALVYSNEPLRLHAGDRVTVRGDLRLIGGPRNPGEFDFRSFYRKRNVWVSIYENPEHPIALTGRDSSFSLNVLVEKFRNSAKNVFQETVGGDAGRLMSALTVGLREEIPGGIRKDFVDTGVVHVLAISGLHVGFVLVIFVALAKLLRLPYRWDKIAVIIGLIAYAGLSGGRPSVWRAVIMASFYVIAPLFHREVNLWNIIAASSLLLLIHDPENLLDAGFILSFSAVIAIVFFYQQFDRILPDRFRVSKIQNRFTKGVMALFIVSLCAQIGTLPFTWTFFNRIPVVSVVANVMIVPLVGVLVSSGFAILVLGSWIPHVGDLICHTSWILSEFLFRLTNLFSDLPFAYLELGRPTWINIAQYGVVLGVIFFFLRRDLRRRGLLVVLVAANFFVWPWALQRNTLDLIFLDVGQGDAALIHIPSASGHKTILVDAGTKNFFTDKGETVVVPVLKYLGIDRVDLLIMTHPHQDHIGGVEAVMSSFPVRKVWDTSTSYRTRRYENVLGLISEQSVSYDRVESGTWLEDFGPAHIYILHPDSLHAVSEKNVNDVSIVTKIVYGETSVLLMGDLEHTGDIDLLEFGEMTRANILKVAHHGSATSTSESLLDLVRPEYAVVSVGRGNQFNHPSHEVIHRLENSGAVVLRTDRDGACWFKSDGKRVWIHDWR
ncbi:MAG: DNA internalization-related competence protein ComEC/Rec2 [Candidatus Neomarinimicrobiota bacterium]